MREQDFDVLRFYLQSQVFYPGSLLNGVVKLSEFPHHKRNQKRFPHIYKTNYNPLESCEVQAFSVLVYKSFC